MSENLDYYVRQHRIAEAHAVAKSDAEFDGRTYSSMGAADRKRYFDRAMAGVMTRPPSIEALKEYLLSRPDNDTSRAVYAMMRYLSNTTTFEKALEFVSSNSTESLDG